MPGVDLFPEGYLTLSCAVVSGEEFTNEDSFAVDMLLSESNKRLGAIRMNGGNGITFLGTGSSVALSDKSELDVTLKSASMSRAEKVSVEKVSLSGVVFMTNTPLLVREVVTVDVSLPNEFSLTFSCSTVWRKATSDSGVFETGVKFLELTQDDSDILEKFLLGVR